MFTNVHISIILNSLKVEIAQISITWWVDKMWYVHTMEYYSVIKKKLWNYLATALDSHSLKIWHYSTTKKNKKTKKKWCDIFLLEKVSSRNSLAVQWVGFSTFTAVAGVQILARELRSHRLCSMAQKNHPGEKSQIKNETAMKQNREEKKTWET